MDLNGIFQNRNRFDIIRIDRIESSSFYPIHQNIRVSIVQGSDSTNTYSCPVTTRLPCSRCYRNPRSQSLESRRYIRHRPVDQFIFTNCAYRSCQVYFRLCSITDNNHFFQSLCIFFQQNVDHILVLHNNVLRDVSDKGNLQSRVSRNFDGKVSIHVGSSTVSRTFLDNVCTGDRAECIAYSTGHLTILLRGGGRSRSCLGSQDNVTILDSVFQTCFSCNSIQHSLNISILFIDRDLFVLVDLFQIIEKQELGLLFDLFQHFF